MTLFSYSLKKIFLKKCVCSTLILNFYFKTDDIGIPVYTYPNWTKIQDPDGKLRKRNAFGTTSLVQKPWRFKEIIEICITRMQSLVLDKMLELSRDTVLSINLVVNKKSNL